MTENTDATPRETTFGQDLRAFIRYHLRGRRGMVAAGLLLAVPALWLGGPWLVAVGGLSLLLSLAPCLVMCGLGFCAMKCCDKKPKAGEDAVQNNETAAPTAVSPGPAAPAAKQAEDPTPR